MASDVIQSIGQFESGEAQKQAYDFNANIAEQNARQSELIGAQEERHQRIMGRKALGQMRSAYGASGVTMEGSPMEVLAESAANAELDALNVAYARKSQAVNFRNEARAGRFAGSQAQIAGRIGAAASLMSGAEKAYAGMTKPK